MHDNNILHFIAQYKESIGLIVTGFAGAATHILNKIRKGQKVSLIQSIAHILASGFVGLMVWLICSAIGITGAWMGFMIGTSGYAGAKILDIIDSLNSKAIADIFLDYLRFKLGKK